MPAVTRLGDDSAGHGGWPPRPSDTGSPNVFINGIPCIRVGDHYITHCDPQPECHDGVLSGGSSTVFVNGQPIGRVGDPISCGDTVGEGSPNVNAG